MTEITLLKGIKKIHFIGIGGSGMFPLVEILHSFGYIISGSDVNEGSIIEKERSMGITVTIPHSAECVKNADMVVHTAALLPGNVEMEEAKRLNIPCVERAEMLGAVTALYKHSYCIAGTHGKTTATSMLTQALLTAEVDTAAVIGGRLPMIDGYGRHGEDDIIAVEACEYAYTFLRLRPYCSVLLNIDDDHLDCFGNIFKLQEAFCDFAKLATGVFIYNGDDERCEQIAQEVGVKKLSFGFMNGVDVRAVDARREENGYYGFYVMYDGKISPRIILGVPGMHNIYNALATLACCIVAEVDLGGAMRGISEFRGAGRRFEVLAEIDGVTIADDYAHHPTEVNATLKAMNELPYKRVIALHQPFTYSRTKLHLRDFADALKKADKVYLTPIMGSREVDPGDIVSEDLAALVEGCEVCDNFEDATTKILKDTRPGDLIITMGCGDVYKAAHMIIKAMKGE